MAFNASRAALCLLAIIVLVASTDARAADTPASRGIPIIVMADDSEPESVRRSSDIFHRVITELQSLLSEYDFYVIDEYSIAGKHSWEIRDRRPRELLFEFVDLLVKTGDATLAPRAVILLKIRASKQKKGFSTTVWVSLDGDIFDIDTNAYLTGWKVPERRLSAPRHCEAACLQEVVGSNGRELASTLGDILRERLAYLTRGDAGKAIANPGDDPQLRNRYLVKFRSFPLMATLDFTETMESWAGNPDAEAPQGDSSLFVYNYTTDMKPNDMFRELNRMLLSAGYPENQFKVFMVNRREFQIDKLF